MCVANLAAAAKTRSVPAATGRTINSTTSIREKRNRSSSANQWIGLALQAAQLRLKSAA
jgi:hypothetical protein